MWESQLSKAFSRFQSSKWPKTLSFSNTCSTNHPNRSKTPETQLKSQASVADSTQKTTMCLCLQPDRTLRVLSLTSLMARVHKSQFRRPTPFLSTIWAHLVVLELSNKLQLLQQLLVPTKSQRKRSCQPQVQLTKIIRAWPRQQTRALTKIP